MKLSSFLHFPFFSLGYFLTEIENIFFVFLSSYRNTHESLGELEKAVWKHSPAACVPTAFLVLPNFHWCFDRNTENVFYFLNKSIYHQAKCKKLQLIVNNYFGMACVDELRFPWLVKFSVANRRVPGKKIKRSLHISVPYDTRSP